MGSRRNVPPVDLPSSMALAFGPPPASMEMDVKLIPLTLSEEEPRREEEERREKILQMLSRSSAKSMDEALESLRNDGISEEQLAHFMAAVRAECLMMLLSIDLQEVVLRHLALDNTPSVEEVVGMALFPELVEMLRGF